MAAPSLPGLKDFLDIEGTSFDNELQGYLDASVTTIGKRCGPLSPTTVTEQQRADCGVLLVSSWPVVSVTSAEDIDGVAIDVSDAKVDKGAGIVYLSETVNGLVEIVYVAGYSECPDDLELATYVVADHLWDTQRGRSGSFAQIHGLNDDAPIGGDASYFVMQGFALPRRAMELTRPYIKAGFR